jgi:Putative Holin-like Toxin (Hol-Tox)
MFVQLNTLGGHGFPSQGGDTMEVKDAILIMIGFSTFVIALLSWLFS